MSALSLVLIALSLVLQPYFSSLLQAFARRYSFKMLKICLLAEHSLTRQERSLTTHPLEMQQHKLCRRPCEAALPLQNGEQREHGLAPVPNGGLRIDSLTSPRADPCNVHAMHMDALHVGDLPAAMQSMHADKLAAQKLSQSRKCHSVSYNVI